VTSREQIYKAALEEILREHSRECEGAKCFPRVLTRLEEALEAGEKAGDEQKQSRDSLRQCRSCGGLASFCRHDR
jgi:hypothetical protein